MQWHSIGPALVVHPRDPSYRRVSSQNTFGAQCEVEWVAVAESDPDVVYVVSRPWVGGASAHRTDDGGESWTTISDVLVQVDHTCSPTCVAVSWDDAQLVVLGDANGMVHVSQDGGTSWPTSGYAGGMVNIVLVDKPRVGNAPPVIYAGTQAGLYRSIDGGSTFNVLLHGAVCDLAAEYAESGAANYFAAVTSTGVYHATDPTTVATPAHPDGWTLLSTRLDGGAGPGMLPSPLTPAAATSGAYFDQIRLAVSHRVPGRAYVWLSYRPQSTPDQPATRALYVSDDPRSTWSMIAVASPPQIYRYYYAFRFAAVPAVENDPGPDVLFMCAGAINRSTDGGQTWSAADLIHSDYHAIAFHPKRIIPGQRVTAWFGSDGGPGRDGHVADPRSDFVPATYWDQQAQVTAIATSVRTRYYSALAVHDMATVRGAPALAYAASVDTGVAAFSGDDTWRTVGGADTIFVAARTSDRGVTCWMHDGSRASWPNFSLQIFADDGSFGSGVDATAVTLQGSNGVISTTSNLVVGPDGSCCCGGQIRDMSGTLQTAVAAVGSATTVTPSSMAFISVGSRIVLPDESVDVTAVTDTTFTATFGKTHQVGAAFQVEREVIVRSGTDGVAAIIGQEMRDFGRSVSFVAAHPTNADVVYAYTYPGSGNPAHQIIRTDAASTASIATAWEVVSTDQPADTPIASIAITNSGAVYVLLASTPPAGPATALYEVSSGRWQPVAGATQPAVSSGESLGRLVVDPADDSRLYAAYRGSVYRIDVHGVTATWTDLSDGLPGTTVMNLEAVDVGAAGSPHTVLRACLAASTVFERDVVDTPDAAPRPFLRAHVSDVGYLLPRTEGQPNPYVPAQPVWHFQSPDVKVDALTDAPGSTGPWFQNDPEFSTLPIDSVTFGQLNDHSQQLPGGSSVRVHVQVHNRSDRPAHNVKVWALVGPAAAGLPSLARSDSMGNRFDFWAQFDPSTGDIMPALPADSPWRPVGPPQTISSITADRGEVATWTWTTPASSDQPQHYCVAVFVHSAAAPLSGDTFDLDRAALDQAQIAQKNLHIMPVLIGGGG